MKVSSTQDKLLSKLYRNTSLEELSEIFNISVENIQEKVKQLKLTKPLIRNRLLPLLNFEDLTVCYWLGFIVADGYLGHNGNLTVTCHPKDKEHLQKLANLLQIKLNLDKNPHGYAIIKKDHYKIAVSDYINGKKLRDFFDIGDSTKTLTPPSIKYLSNTNCIMAFFIGFFDGDGCIDYTKKHGAKGMKIEIHANWIDRLLEFQQFLEKNFDITSYLKINSRGFALFRINKYNDLKKFKEFIIKHNLPAIDRKWDLIDLNKYVRPLNVISNNKEKFMDLYNKGTKVEDIAKCLNCSIYIIYKYIKDNLK